MQSLGNVVTVMPLLGWRWLGKGPSVFMVPTCSICCLNPSEMRILGISPYSRTTWTSSWAWSLISPPSLGWPELQWPTACWTRCQWSKILTWVRQYCDLKGCPPSYIKGVPVVPLRCWWLAPSGAKTCLLHYLHLVLFLKLDNHSWNGIVFCIKVEI